RLDLPAMGRSSLYADASVRLAQDLADVGVEAVVETIFRRQLGVGGALGSSGTTPAGKRPLVAAQPHRAPAPRRRTAQSHGAVAQWAGDIPPDWTAVVDGEEYGPAVRWLRVLASTWTGSGRFEGAIRWLTWRRFAGW